MAELSDAGVVTDGQSARVGDTLITVLPWWDGPVARLDCEQFLAAGISRIGGVVLGVAEEVGVACGESNRIFLEPATGAWIKHDDLLWCFLICSLKSVH